MSAVWERVLLGEVLAERQEVPPIESVLGGDTPVIAKIGFGDGAIHLRADGHTKTDMILVKPGDIVVSGINAAKGAIAIYHESNTGSVAATIHYSAYAPDKSRVSTLYLWWYLRSGKFRDLIQEYVPGGIKTELKAGRLLSIPVQIPPLREQERIVARIEEAAARIQESKLLRTCIGLATAKLMGTAIQDAMARCTELGRFGDVITFRPRSGPSFLTDPSWHGIPVLMPSAVSGFGVDITKVEFGLGNEKISAKDFLEPGDILIARGNKKEQVGNAGIVPPQAAGWVCANLLMRLQVDDSRVNPHFCIYWLRSPYMRDYVRRKMNGTNPNIQKINQQTILNYPFPLCLSIRNQHQIVSYLDQLQLKAHSLKRLQEESSSALNALMPSVLDKAFRGEL